MNDRSTQNAGSSLSTWKQRSCGSNRLERVATGDEGPGSGRKTTHNRRAHARRDDPACRVRHHSSLAAPIAMPGRTSPIGRPLRLIAHRLHATLPRSGSTTHTPRRPTVRSLVQALLSVAGQQSTGYYDGVAARYADYTSRFDMDAVLGDFFATITRQHVALDVGCGAGRDLASLHGVTSLSIGLDLSSGLLNEVRRRTTAPAIQADASSIPLADASVDRLIAVASLHHLPRASQIAALREIRRVLTAEGQAFVTLKVGSGLVRDVDNETGLERFFHLVQTKTVLDRGRMSGLRVVSASESSVVRHGGAQRWLACQFTRSC